MRQIHKNVAPATFRNFVKQSKPKVWDDIKKSGFAEGMKACRKYILEIEQMGLGGYTELPLKYDGSDVHIDHFKKRADYPKDTFKWDNLIVDKHVHDKSYGADCKDDHVTCQSYDRIINPVTEDPHHYFRYMNNGEIVPKDRLSDNDKQKALCTIGLFNLNHRYLLQRRSGLINQINSCHDLDYKVIKNSLSDQGFLSVIEYFTNTY